MSQIFICIFAATGMAALTAVFCGATHQLLIAAISGAMCALLMSSLKEEAKNEN
ncbi:MAG: hypothetical protein RBS19_00400 [Bacteroidales bacterium]|nr:hypothetical protein [Bacteroidales bacterium]